MRSEIWSDTLFAVILWGKWLLPQKYSIHALQKNKVHRNLEFTLRLTLAQWTKKC